MQIRIYASQRALGGFTFIELMISLSVAVILIAASSANFTKNIERHQAQQDLDNLYHSLQLARLNAINLGSVVTVCPSRNGRDCSAVAEAEKLIIFSDFNNNRVVDESDIVVSKSNISQTIKRLQWFPSNKPYYQFAQNGRTYGTFGRVCYLNKDGTYFGQKIVVNLQGRIKYEKIPKNTEECRT